MSSVPIQELDQEPKDLGKEACAIALRRALAASGRFATIRELATASGIKYDTLKKYFSGRHLPSAETWRRLAGILSRETLTSPVSPAEVSARTTAEPAATRSLDQAREVRRTIERLVEQLEFFKRGSKEDRENLRRSLPGRDVGYITSLLRALYDEDQFEAWILFSEYSLGGRPDEGSRNRR